eukprot:snap_masked-scaffold_35-processed-gene-2.59-mRNA-1 protein AED:1.00 eAED:1.00 QI:0/0/0/0/1/1/2/0/71
MYKTHGSMLYSVEYGRKIENIFFPYVEQELVQIEFDFGFKIFATRILSYKFGLAEERKIAVFLNTAGSTLK